MLNRIFDREAPNMTCPAHGAGHVVWMEKRHAVGNGRVVSHPVPYCTAGDRPHALRSKVIEGLRVMAEQIGAPLPFSIRVTDDNGGSGKSYTVDSAPSNTPAGIAELPTRAQGDLVYSRETHELLDRARVRIEKGPALYARNPSLRLVTEQRNSFMFFGPPGTGKTSAFAVLTEGIIARRVSVSLRSMLGAFQGSTEKNMNDLIEFVRANASAPHQLAVLADDADDFCGARSDDSSAAGQSLNGARVALLRLLDSAPHAVFVFTTNRASTIDRAIERRIVAHIPFPRPDAAVRSDLLKRHLDYIGAGRVEPAHLAVLVEASDEMSQAEIAEAMIDAAIEADGMGVAALVESAARAFGTRRRNIAQARSGKDTVV